MNSPKIELWPIDKPMPYENNPRINDNAAEAVANSIREFGFRSPIIVDRGGAHTGRTYPPQSCKTARTGNRASCGGR